MPDRVLPAVLRVPKVGILVRQVLVDVREGQTLLGGAIDGLGNQAGVADQRLRQVFRVNR